MNIFINLGSDPIKNSMSEKVGNFPLIYFWFKDYFYQKYGEYYTNTKWDWHDLYRNFLSDDDELKDKLKNNPPDVFAQSIYIWNEPQMFETAKWVKENFPDCLVVAGGPSAEGKESFFQRHPYYDISINGPGAEVFSRILKHKLEKKSLNGIDGISLLNENKEFIINEYISRKDDPLILNYANNLTDETKSVILKMQEEYDLIRFQTLLIQGCPYSCSFCEQGQELWTKINKRPLQQLFDEIDLFSMYENTVIDFIDSNFGIHKEYVDIVDYIIDTNKNNDKNKIKIGYFTYAKQNLERVSLIKSKLEEINDLMLSSPGYLALQDLNKEVLEINGRPFSKEDEKIENFYKEVVSGKFYDGWSVELILGMPGQSIDSLITSLVEMNERKIITPSLPYIYTLFPNTPLTESEDFDISYKGNNVYISDLDIEPDRGGKSFFQTSEYRKNLKNPLISNYLIQTPTLSTMDLASSVYFYTLFGRLIGFYNFLEYPSYYLMNYYQIKESEFLKKILKKFDSKNHENLPKKIHEDIESIYKWLTGETKFLERMDCFNKYYLEPNTLSSYRWMADTSLFIDNIFYSSFVELTGHNDIIFKNLLDWNRKKTLTFNDDCFNDNFEISYNYDDIAIKKTPVFYLSEFNFNFEYKDIDNLYFDLFNHTLKKQHSILEHKELSDKKFQKPLSLS